MELPTPRLAQDCSTPRRVGRHPNHGDVDITLGGIDGRIAGNAGDLSVLGVDRKDPASVPEFDKVLQGPAVDLGEVIRSADDGDRSRIQYRAQGLSSIAHRNPLL